MNNNTNVWAVRLGRPNASEMVQRMAFSFGYEWANPTLKQTVSHKDAPVIYFRPTNKLMVPVSRPINIEADVCKICLTLEEVLVTLQDPPVVKVEEPKRQPSRLPAVQFNYNSPSSGRRLRKILVTDSTLDYVMGLDVQDGNLFKRFSKSRIVGPMTFVGLSETRDW